MPLSKNADNSRKSPESEENYEVEVATPMERLQELSRKVKEELTKIKRGSNSQFREVMNVNLLIELPSVNTDFS
jgi:hypothetical protein